jgi:hypothetical protein
VKDFEPSAVVIADSVAKDTGYRVTTMQVRLHRFMLPEFNTHRAFSRNSASSRAIPVNRQFIKMAEEPAVPLLWPGERKGMQGGPPLPTEKAIAAREVWLRARDEMMGCAEAMVNLGVHKSVVNRLLEPFLPHTVVVTATDWGDFYAQRLPPQDGSEPLAQAEIVAAAIVMRKAYTDSTPAQLIPGEWHLPYLDDWELKSMPVVQAKQVSVARCARTSYLTQDGKRDVAEDLNLYRRLLHASPPHWSPFEHVATPAVPDEPVKGNFTGWHQLRHMHPGVHL